MSDADRTNEEEERSVIQTLTTRVDEIENARERGIAALITAVILAGLIIGSSPAAAVSTSVSGPGQVDLADDTSDTVELTYEVDIEEGERVPVEGVQFDIAEAGGDDTSTVSVDLATNQVVGGDGDDAGAINTSALNPTLVGVTTNYPSDETRGYGYGYGYQTGTEFGYGYDAGLGYGYGYDSTEVGFGYGYGYSQNGYGYGATTTPTEFNVTIAVDKAAFATGADGGEKDYGVTGSVITEVTSGYSVGDISQTVTNFDTAGEGTGHTFSVLESEDPEPPEEDPEPPEEDPEPPEEDPEESISAPVSGNQSTAEFGTGTATQSATVSDLPAGVSTVTFESVGTSNPSSDTLPVSDVGVYLNITPDTDVSGPVTVTVTVSNATVSGIEDPSMYHDPGSGWEELSTTTTVTSNGTQLTATTTNGLSPFAIAASTASTTDPGSGTPSTGGGGGGGGGGSLSTDFTVSELTPEEAEVTQGTEITVSATVSSTSYLEQRQEVELRIDGETVATQEVTLSSRDSTTVAFENVDTSGLEGEYEHGIFTEADSETGTLTVTPAADEEEAPADSDSAADDEETTAEEEATAEETADEDTADGETEDGTPGFGIIVGILALVSLALLARRRIA